jgi:prolyl-tRNA editing enzyme YbaK/EbsC (Cys-tRNA(Pro) deacylase)
LQLAISSGIFATMSLESVRAFFASHAPDIDVIVTELSSATVPLAAEAHGVEPDQIAKTICLRAGEETMLVVMSGMSRLDNRKFRDRFGPKPRMLGGEEVVAITSHPVGGVCPFGLATALPVYCDISLKRFGEVVPAAGATNAAVRISPERIVELTGATWIDVAQDPANGAQNG